MVKLPTIDRLPYLYAIIVPVLATGLGYGVEYVFHKGNISLVYLLAVLLVASRSSYKPALLCALVSFILYNLFFTNPRLSLLMTHREDILTVFFFVVVALIAGHQAARLRNQIFTLETQEKFLQVQLNFAQTLQQTMSPTEVLDHLCTTIERAFGGKVTVSISPEETSVCRGRPQLSTEEYIGVIKRLTFSNSPFSPNLTVVLQSNSDALPEQWHTVVDTLHHHANLALERTRLAEKAKQESLRAEEEQLRSALFASVSHDLKTPLAAMIGSATSLRDLGADLSTDDKDSLLDAIIQEAQRLESYIQNLLDMTRLGRGDLQLNRQIIGVGEIIHVVLKRIKQLQTGHQITLSITKDLPSLNVHPALIEQALFNVIDNALKFSPPHSTINLTVHQQDSWLQIDVADAGPGIPENERAHVFEFFHSVSRGDVRTVGSGLGLTICQGMLGAHGGYAEVLDSNKGATIRLNLPIDLDDSNELPNSDH